MYIWTIRERERKREREREREREQEKEGERERKRKKESKNIIFLVLHLVVCPALVSTSVSRQPLTKKLENA
jgi:hypothetical protein